MTTYLQISIGLTCAFLVIHLIESRISDRPRLDTASVAMMSGLVMVAWPIFIPLIFFRSYRR